MANARLGGSDELIGGAGNDQLVGGLGADFFGYGRTGWGRDQIFDFSRTEGDAFDFRGSGLAFADLLVDTFGAYPRISKAGTTIDVYGLAGLLEADFLFS